jgi:hypothetical protein
MMLLPGASRARVAGGQRRRTFCITASSEVRFQHTRCWVLTLTDTRKRSAGELGRLGVQGLRDYFAQLGLSDWSCNNATKELTALWPTCQVEELKTRAAALERMLPGVDVAEMVKRDYVVLLADPGEPHVRSWG